jgi:ATP/maltotriose-dependent transcriptional regulator MalT/DNA-binding SARP family transcriptional activator
MSGYDEFGRAQLIGKIVPPPTAPHVVERPRITAYLETAPRRRVTVLSAGAGFGKTTVLTGWATGRHCAWYTLTVPDQDPVVLARGLLASLALRVPALPDDLTPALDARGPDAVADDISAALVPALAGALHSLLPSDVTLVIDDLQELDEHSAALRVIADLCHMAPPRLHIVLGTRSDLPFPTERLRLRGQLQILTAESLRFDRLETERLLAALGDGDLVGYAAAVHELTGGWPAAVRLVAEALATTTNRELVLAGLVRQGGTVTLVEDLLSREVLSRARPELAELLRVGAALDSFDAELLGSLGITNAPAVLGSARRRGIHVQPAPAADGWYSLSPMTKEYALARLVTDPEQLTTVRIAAAGWHAEHGDPVTAVRYLDQAGDAQGLARLLERHGSALLAAGHATAVAAALEHLPADARSPVIDLVEGEACQVRGDWDRAVRCLSRLVPESGPAPAAAAWRLGLIHHMRGEPDRALAVYVRGQADPDGSAADRALAAAWGSAAAWLTGDVPVCRELAERATELAEAGHSARAKAATHTALAMLAALDGDRRSNDMHYLRALDHAQEAGDVLQIIRIRANRGSRFLEEGYYAEAIAELDTAVSLADLAGFASLRTLAVHNRGEAARRLGRLDDAARDLQAALAEQQRLGSRMASYPLVGLGHIHADQGNLSLARACFEEALALAEPTGDLQGLVPALIGLALTLAAEDPATATRLIDRALAVGANLSHTSALLAAGRIALRRGEPAKAREYAETASAEARLRRDRAGIAEALELRAGSAADRAERISLLEESEAIWRALGCQVPLARTRIALARIRAGIGSADRDRASADLAETEQICRELGARALTAEAAAARAELASRAAPDLSVRTLGGFQVFRRGVLVPHSAWQSRKARDLLKILIARREVPITRDQLCELLWPDVAADRAAARLSVALSTLRSVLDPQRVHPSDHYLASQGSSVWLRRSSLDIDVEAFLAQANAALGGVAGVTGAAGTPGAQDALAQAEAAYTGDFCAEDRYADWATVLREEARAAYVAVARALARRHAGVADHETAARFLLRLLACEPYDEQAYLLLVRELDAAGRHGDARRMYRAYAARMAELDVEQAPYPDEPRGGKVRSGAAAL